MLKWLAWGYWTSPMMYAQTALSTNEYLGNSWNRVPKGSNESVGISVLKSRGLFVNPNWYWVCFAASIGFIVFINAIPALALAFLNEYWKPQTVLPTKRLRRRNTLTRVTYQRTLNQVQSELI